MLTLDSITRVYKQEQSYKDYARESQHLMSVALAEKHKYDFVPFEAEVVGRSVND